MIEGFTPWPEKEAREYKAKGYWPGLTIYQALERWIKETPHKEAIVDEKVRLTYNQFAVAVRRLSIALYHLKIKKEDRVIVQLPNCSEFLICFFALSRIGAIPVPVIPQFRQKDIGYLLNLTGASTIIIPDVYHSFDHTRMVRELRPESPLLKHVIVVGQQIPLDMVDYNKIMSKADETIQRDSPDSLKPDADDVAFISLTGGTTGFPKGVPHTHNDFVGARLAFLKAARWDANTIILINKPVELYASLARGLSALIGGGKMVLSTSSRPADTLKAIEDEKITDLQIVPTEGVDLLGFPDIHKYNTGSLRELSCGVGAFTSEQLKSLAQRLGCKITKAYGMTEGISLITRPDEPIEVVLETVGKPLSEADEAKIVDEKGDEVADGIEGELVFRGASVIRGYYKNPEATKEAVSADGFFHTGDLAVKDNNGNIRITGRKKDWIRRGGQTIVPLEVESNLLSHPKVENVAVVAMPDPRLGEKACAYIKPKNGQAISLEEVTSFLLEKGMAKYKLPERVEIISELPLVGMGKMDKKALREDITRKLAAESKL